MAQGAPAYFAHDFLARVRTTPAFFGALATLSALLFALGTGPDAHSATLDSATLAASKSLEAKLQILGRPDTRPSASYPPLVITQHEANAYLQVHSGEFLPPGVRNLTMALQPQHAKGAADVNFEEMSRSYPDPNDMGPKILAAMFKGTQHVTITAKVQSESAGVRVQIESVVVGTMTVPNWLVDYVIQNVLQPRYKFDLSKPLEYPDHVTQIVLGTGQAIFLRGRKSGQ